MTNELKPPRLLTIKEASKLIEGVSEYRIRQWVKQGKINFIFAGTKALVNIDSLIQKLNLGDAMEVKNEKG